MATSNITIPTRAASGPEGKHAPARMKLRRRQTLH